jgi:hypothetical protein
MVGDTLGKEEVPNGDEVGIIVGNEVGEEVN